MSLVAQGRGSGVNFAISVDVVRDIVSLCSWHEVKQVVPTGLQLTVLETVCHCCVCMRRCQT